MFDEFHESADVRVKKCSAFGRFLIWTEFWMVILARNGLVLFGDKILRDQSKIVYISIIFHTSLSKHN